MSDLTTLQTRLSEAEAALHKLMTGAQEVTVELSGFGTATYNQVNTGALERYILRLKQQISCLQGGGRRPILTSF